MKSALIGSNSLPFRPRAFWLWLALWAVVIWLSVFAAAQTATPAADLRQHYRYFSVLSHAKLEEKLSESTLSGYRLLEVQETEGGAIVAVMEDVSASGKKFEYRVLRAEWSRFAGGQFSKAERPGPRG